MARAPSPSHMRGINAAGAAPRRRHAASGGAPPVFHPVKPTARAVLGRSSRRYPGSGRMRRVWSLRAAAPPAGLGEERRAVRGRSPFGRKKEVIYYIILYNINIYRIYSRAREGSLWSCPPRGGLHRPRTRFACGAHAAARRSALALDYPGCWSSGAALV